MIHWQYVQAQVYLLTSFFASPLACLASPTAHVLQCKTALQNLLDNPIIYFCAISNCLLSVVCNILCQQDKDQEHDTQRRDSTNVCQHWPQPKITSSPSACLASLPVTLCTFFFKPPAKESPAPSAYPLVYMMKSTHDGPTSESEQIRSRTQSTLYIPLRLQPQHLPRRAAACLQKRVKESRRMSL